MSNSFFLPIDSLRQYFNSGYDIISTKTRKCFLVAVSSKEYFNSRCVGCSFNPSVYIPYDSIILDEWGHEVRVIDICSLNQLGLKPFYTIDLIGNSSNQDSTFVCPKIEHIYYEKDIECSVVCSQTEGNFAYTDSLTFVTYKNSNVL